MLKAVAKRIVKKEHWLFLCWYRSLYGFLPAIHAYLNMLINKGIGRAPNELSGGFVFLRPGTTDQNVYNQVFVKKDYDVDLCNPLFIVDAGAHIGLSSVFFASKYPKAIVIAIEPEPTNFKLLLMNTRNFSNIRPIQAGLWSRKTHLRIQNSNAAAWNFRVSEDSSGQGVTAVGILDVMSDFRVSQIDVLKLDIEGSEIEVLDTHPSWIDAVGALIIELHDSFRPGCSEALARAICSHNYDLHRSGENIVITNLKSVAT